MYIVNIKLISVCSYIAITSLSNACSSCLFLKMHDTEIALTIGLKVSRMTWTIWVTWVTFLEGQVGIMHKLNYLDVTQISHVY